MKSPARNFKQQFEYTHCSFNQQGAEAYCYEYQGQFAEEDHETGWNQFELRMYDSRIGRWTTTDPNNHGFSAYWAMDNNPISLTDPEGGCPNPPCSGDFDGIDGGSIQEIVVEYNRSFWQKVGIFFWDVWREWVQ